MMGPPGCHPPISEWGGSIQRSAVRCVRPMRFGTGAEARTLWGVAPARRGRKGGSQWGAVPTFLPPRGALGDQQGWACVPLPLLPGRRE